MLALTIGGVLEYGCLGFLWFIACIYFTSWLKHEVLDFEDEWFNGPLTLLIFLGSLIGGPALLYFLRKYVFPLIGKFLSTEIF